MKRTEKLLAPLASLKAQEKYIIGASKDEYYVPDELLEQASSSLILEDQTGSVKYLKKKIDDLVFPGRYSAHELVHECQPWVELREVTKAYLKEIGFDLKEWEENEL